MNIVIKNYKVRVKHDKETGLYVGIIPGLVGAHTQAETLDELKLNLEEVMELLLSENNSSGESNQ
jgi:predicted RNase H-like HicB family nuclease